jgi:hypothetical protein
MNRILTASDFCQGHGGGRDCPFSPEAGCLDHGDDFDHGVVSFCDGTCPEAREEYVRHLRQHGMVVEPVTDSITLAVHGGGRSYQVTFEGAHAAGIQLRAMTYMGVRPDLHFSEVEDAPVAPKFAIVLRHLYPTCHHGLSLDLCMDAYGDNHFGTREQEMANTW